MGRNHSPLRAAPVLAAALLTFAAACSNSSAHIPGATSTATTAPAPTSAPISTTASATPNAVPTITSHGTVPVTLVSADGPLGGGPYAATNLSALDAAFRAVTGGAPTCGHTPCWSGAPVPADSLLIAAQAAPTTCYAVAGVDASLTAATTLRIAITTTYLCATSGGGGQVPILPDSLFAIPLAALPAGAHLTVVVTSTFGPSAATNVVLPPA